MASVSRNASNVTTAASGAAIDVLDTVGQVAKSTSQLVGSTTKFIDMLDNWATTAHSNQIARTIEEADDFYEKLIEESALDRAKRAQELERTLSENPELKKQYEENYNHISSLLLAQRKHRKAELARRYGYSAVSEDNE